MNLYVHDNDIKLPYMADNLLSRKCHKLERMLHRFPPGTLSLTVDILPAANGKDFRVQLHLKIPNAALSSRAVGSSAVTALSSAFKKLFQSVAELKSSLRAAGDIQQKKKSFEKVLSGSMHGKEPVKRFADFFSSSYSRFYNYALREIRFRSYLGYTQPGTLEVTDILDEALLAAGHRFAGGYSETEALRICYNEIRKMIEDHLQNDHTAPVPIEKPIEPEDIDTDYQEYYLPDEVILVEDILINPDSITPEQEFEYREIETRIDKLLAQLPSEWREVFILYSREDIPLRDIARNKNTSEVKIRQILEETRNFIRSRLDDAGFAWNGNNSQH